MIQINRSYFLHTCNYILNQQQTQRMELKKELVEWYNAQLEQKNIFISSTAELATGYHFLEILHYYHPKNVEISKSYLKPKNQFEVLQNYKLLANCFAKLGWKKLDPERYSKKKEKDYLSLAQTLRKILSSRSIKQSRLQSNLDVTLQQFKSEQKVQQQKVPQLDQKYKKTKIIQLQKTKRELLSKISQIHQQLYKEIPGEDPVRIQTLRLRINQIVTGNIVLN